MKTLKNIFNLADNLELLIYGLLGAAVLVGFPILLAVREWREGREWISGLLIIGIAAAVFLGVKEIKRGYLGWVTGLLFGIWILLTLCIGFVIN